MSDNKFDLVVIGSGPGGYVGAIRAAQLGMKVAVVEKEKVYGGTCLNVGCIPSKALLDSSENFAAAKHEFAQHGVKIGKVELDLPTMMKRKEKIVSSSTQGIAYLFKKNNITPFEGMGSLKSANEVIVTKADGSTTSLTTLNVMLATGSVPNELPHLKFDGKFIISSTEALSLSQVPAHLVVVGGGYIGLEMGSVWLRLGAQVTVVEFADHICGSMDRQISSMLQRILERQGMKFLLGTKVTGAPVKGMVAHVQCENIADGTTQVIEADKVLVAAGRKPFTQGLGLEKVGVQLDQMGRVVVDDNFATTVPGVYAIGDMIRGPMLAHKAEEEGVAVAEIIAGQHGHVNYHTVPGIIYTWPEVASVGYSEEQLKEKGIPYKTGSYPFTPNGRAKAMGYTDGVCKVLAHAETDRVLGVHILGPRASDMIAEAVMAMEFAASSEDIARAFHAHPTLAEIMREAALAVDKRARQI